MEFIGTGGGDPEALGHGFRFDLQRFAGGDDGGETGADAGGGAGQEPGQGQEAGVEGAVDDELVPKSQLDAAQNEIRDLRTRLDQLTQTMMRPEYLQALRGEPAAAPTRQAREEEPEEAEEPDWDRMTPKDLAKWVSREVQKSIQPHLQDVNQRADVIRARQEIAEAQAKYPDFMQYRDDMIAIARQYEAKGIQLSAEDAYFMAKGRAGTRQPARTNGQATGAPVAKPKGPKPPASGEKPGVSPAAAQKGSLSAREAAEEAWKKAGLDKILGG